MMHDIVGGARKTFLEQEPDSIGKFGLEKPIWVRLEILLSKDMLKMGGVDSKSDVSHFSDIFYSSVDLFQISQVMNLLNNSKLVKLFS